MTHSSLSSAPSMQKVEDGSSESSGMQRNVSLRNTFLHFHCSNPEFTKVRAIDAIISAVPLSLEGRGLCEKTIRSRASLWNICSAAGCIDQDLCILSDMVWHCARVPPNCLLFLRFGVSMTLTLPFRNGEECLFPSNGEAVLHKWSR